MAGGGYHVTQRKYEGQYIKVESLFQVPMICVSVHDASENNRNGVYPEFVHGFHTNSSPSYSIDAGLIYSRHDYDGNKWRLFHGSPNALFGGYDDKGKEKISLWEESEAFSLTPGSQVYMSTVISIQDKQIITELRTSRTTAPFRTLRTPLITAAHNAAVRYGCLVYRELLMATNRKDTSYYNTAARFEFAKFTYGKLTTLSAQEVDMKDTGYQGTKVDNGFPLVSSRVKTKAGAEAYEGKAFAYELGSCDMRANPHFDYSF